MIYPQVEEIAIGCKVQNVAIRAVQELVILNLRMKLEVVPKRCVRSASNKSSWKKMVAVQARNRTQRKRDMTGKATSVQPEAQPRPCSP